MSDDNPYASPAAIEEKPPSEIELVRDEITYTFHMYHQQVMGLWIGLVSVGLGFGIMTVAMQPLDARGYVDVRGTSFPTGFVIFCLCPMLLFLGICSYQRSLEAYRFTKICMSVLLIGAIIALFFLDGISSSAFFLGAAAVSLVFCYQAHTVIKWAKRLQAFGIPTGRLSLTELNEILESRSRTTSQDHERPR